MRNALFSLLVLTLATPCLGERINHEGRILGPEPVVTEPVLFNTPEADAIVSAMQIFPRNNPWNEDITNRPVHANSVAMISQIISDLASNRRTLRPFYEMNFVLVPDSQPALSIRFNDYPDESDLDGGTDPNGLYPMPSNLPIETWPRETGGLSLSQWQTDVNDEGGDRHSIIVKPGGGFIWETWQTKRVGGAWEASNGAKFNLNSNAPRPDGWTSADAAGLPMFPALVRYDECQRGMVEHALRLVVRRSRRAYIYPATHYASSLTGANYPAMGQRLRLKSSFAIPDNWTIHEKAVLRALKKYGAIVADNGNFFSVSVAPDERFPSNAFDHLSTIGIDNFEVIQTTGPNEGPRSPGAPSCDAGPDEYLEPGVSAQLHGSVLPASTAAQVKWSKYSGPGDVSFTAPTSAETSASFSHPGCYVLMLSAGDGIHTTAFDAVKVDVRHAVEILREGDDIIVRFPSAEGQSYRVERRDAVDDSGGWDELADEIPGTGQLLEVTHAGGARLITQFYRVLTSGSVAAASQGVKESRKTKKRRAQKR
ncbi:MAG: hypothetical protein ABI680_13090 [Chthoniobacteraceae bacterium]